MTRNRVYDMNKYMHFNNNTKAVQNRDDTQHERFDKVRPILSMLRLSASWARIKMSIDEQMIPYKDKNSLRQNLPPKT